MVRELRYHNERWDSKVAMRDVEFQWVGTAEKMYMGTCILYTLPSGKYDSETMVLH